VPLIDQAEWLNVIVQIAAAAGVIWGVTKIPYYRWQKWLSSNRKDRKMLDTDVPGLVRAVAELKQAVAVVQSELIPNHGTSLRDAINRIERLAIKSDRTAEAWLNLDPRAMYTTDDKGLMDWCNRSYVVLTGRPKEDLYGLGYLSTIAKHDLDRVAKVIQDFEHRGIFTSELSFDMTVPDNGTVPVSATNHAMHDTEGHLVGIVGYIEIDDGKNWESSDAVSRA